MQLESEKIVVIQNNKSVHVNKLSPNELEEIFWLRLTLEKKAAEKACDNWKESDLPAIKRLLQEMWESIDDPATYFKKNHQFHLSVYELAKSPILLYIIDNLWSRIGPYYNFRTIGSDYREKIAMPSHEALYDALVNRDKIKITKALEKNVSPSYGVLLGLLDKPNSMEKKGVEKQA